MVLQALLSALGALTLLCFLLSLLTFIRLYTRRSSLPRYHHGGHPWALVTGSTDGIGLALASALATKNFSVILHGRNPAKLSALAARLAAAHPSIETRTLVCDATSPSTYTHDGLAAIAAAVDGVHLTVLINNIGGVECVTRPAVAPMSAMDHGTVDKLIDVNLRFPTQLTRAVWPALTRHRAPALVLNVGSAADLGTPYAAVYGGAKAYNMSWSRGLRAESMAEGENVEVLGVRVGKVTDVSHRKEAVSFVVPSAQTMARAALDRVGCGRAVVVGYWVHALQVAPMALIPERLLEKVLTGMMKELQEKERKEMKGG